MVGSGTLEDFRFGVCDRLRRSEEADVGVTHICPYAQLWLGNGDKRADFARMIHAQFHHRDVRLLSKLQQRQRQADVIVEVPLVLHHPNRAERSSAIASFVVVFPALPVMATTRAPLARRTACPRRCKAIVVSSTSMTAPCPLATFPPKPRLTIAAGAAAEGIVDEVVPVAIAAKRDENRPAAAPSYR